MSFGRSRAAPPNTAEYTPLVPSSVDSNVYSYTSSPGSFRMLLQFFAKPLGRKIQYLAYGIANAVMLGVAVAYVDTSAAFQMYYSATYDPSRAFSLQVEWLTVMFAAVRVITCFWKAFNIRNAYESGVESGFCLINWIDLMLVGALILCQLFVMLGNFVLGYLLCFALLWGIIVMALGFQEHQNKMYAIVTAVARRDAPLGDDAIKIRDQRLAYFGLTCIFLFGALALLGSQAAYDSIKGATDLPSSLKAYVAVTVFFVAALAGNIAYNILKSGEAKTKDEAVFQHQLQDANFGLLMFLWSSAAVAFVFSILHYNDNLSFELSTPLQTIN